MAPSTSAAVRRGPLLVTVQVPRTAAGEILRSGGIEEQSRCVFNQMKTAIEEAGASLADIAIVQVYLIDMADWAGMNRVWGEFFASGPALERATIGVKELAVPGMLIEIIATAYLPDAPR